VAVAVLVTGFTTAAPSAQTGDLLDDAGDLGVELPGGGGVELPDEDGGGGVTLPGGGGVQLPGGGDDGDSDVNLPGGTGVDLPGGDEPEPEPAPPPPDDATVPPPADDGTVEGSATDSTDGTAGPSGGRGDGGRGGGRERGGRGDEASGGVAADPAPHPAPVRRPDGVPTSANPSLTIGGFGPAPLGVPNFVIDQFTIPPFLLPIYQACGTQYGIPWQVLASINRIETAFGTNLNVSTAGALGWMQFIPSTWDMYGVDANEDGRKDPYNPVDAICAAARYLKAAGGQQDLRTAIFAYNHADWYVDEVLLYANQYGKLPEALVSSLTGLTEGARFPVAADARYADDISERRALERSKPGKRPAAGNAAEVIASSPTRRGIDIYSKEGAPVVAVNDGVITDVGRSKRLGRFVVLRDDYGNRFTYAELGDVARAYPVPKEGRSAATAPEPEERRDRSGARGPVNTEDSRERVFAFPERAAPAPGAPLTVAIDPVERYLERAGYESFEKYFGVARFDPDKSELRPLREGSEVIAGTMLGHVGKTDEYAPHVNFSIRPAGRGAPTVDPKPILDGWKLLEATHIYRAVGKNPFEDSAASSGQVLLLSKEQAIRAVLADPRVEIYECGRADVQTGQIDVRVMRMLLYLARSGFRTTVTSLKCGHSVYTSSGSVSQHSTGGAVDIAQINGLPVLGQQGPGSITEALINQLLQLQGTMVPDQVISLMQMGGPTFAMGDHADHVHVGYAPGPGTTTASEPQITQVLKPEQWRRLIARLAEIDNPEVATAPSRFAQRTKREDRASVAHRGE
jgi:hypothetical protein